jgi:hypothetical protein
MNLLSRSSILVLILILVPNLQSPQLDRLTLTNEHGTYKTNAVEHYTVHNGNNWIRFVDHDTGHILNIWKLGTTVTKTGE